MVQGVSPGLLLAGFGPRPGRVLRVAPVGLEFLLGNGNSCLIFRLESNAKMNTVTPVLSLGMFWCRISHSHRGTKRGLSFFDQRI